MKAAEWIDKVKAARGWDTDYRVSKELGLSRSAVSIYRSKGTTLEEGTAIKVAAALGERPEAVLLDQYAERTKNPAVRSALTDAARKLCILCKIPAAMELVAVAARSMGHSVVFS
jgi:transcriptional regulator with XRE-family HTH domain